MGATTAGAVIGVGIRRGDALGPFIGAGRMLLSTPGGLVPLPWLAFLSGMVLHAILMLAVGGIFALFAARARGPLLAGSAAAYAVLVYLVVRWMGWRALGAFGAIPASLPQWIFLLALLAAALIAGIRWSRVSP